MARNMQDAAYQFPELLHPQLGGDVNLRHVRSAETGQPKYTKKGAPQIELGNQAVDLSDPYAIEAAKRNVIHSIRTASPEMQEFGSQWYPKVHEAVSKGVTGGNFLSSQFDKHLAGSALVAAVSPNMDWDKANIDAFGELRSIDTEGWAKIMAGDRSVYKGMSISSAPLANVQKAGRIIAGEDPNDVLRYGSAPKTHSFMHNINDPSNSQFVTVDGRAFDTLNNRLMPWGSGRGIAGSTFNPEPTKSGRPRANNPPSRYTGAADIYREAAEHFGFDPSEAQAISWANMKYGLERRGAAPPGVEMDIGDDSRDQGPLRIGQPYFDPETGNSALHDPRYFAAHRGRMAHFIAGIGA